MIEKIRKNYLLFVIGAAVLIYLFATKESHTVEGELELIPAISTADAEESLDANDEQTIAIVDVKGEVNKPGVYEADNDSRLIDVIELAGGFTEDADEIHVNRAQKVQDEMTVIVPKIGEATEVTTDSASMGTNKVRINNATLEEIETLPGIGPSKAQAIIQYRDEHGLFQTPDDLLEISGIGEKTFENIKDDIQIP